MKAPFKWIRSVSEYLSASISNKIIIPYALLTVILAVFGVFVVTRLVAGSFEARLKNQLLEAGKVVSDGIVSRERFRLEQQRTVAFTIGVPEALVARDWNKLKSLVSPIIENSRTIDSIIVVDTQGNEVLRLQRVANDPEAAVTTELDTGANLFEWVGVRRVLTDSQGLTKEAQLVEDPVSGELLVYTIGPIRDDRGVVGAVLVGTYLEKEILLLREMALADLVLFDKNGNILATTFSETRLAAAGITAIFTPDRYRQVLDQPGITLMDQATGYRLAYAPFILRDHVLGVYAVALPTNFITDTNNQSRNRLALVFSLGVVAVFLVGYLVSRRIIRPITHLVQTARAITAGELNRRTGLTRSDEIGVLANAFDHMTEELQQMLRRQTEEASKLNAILNSIADGVIVQNIEGEVVLQNPAAEQVLAKMDEHIALAAKTGDQTASKRDELARLEFHEVKRLEFGRLVISALSSPVVTPAGEKLGSVVILRDITREVESDKLKDDFITSVSHELRTPLTAIKGYNDLLKMTASSLTDQQKQFVAAIETHVGELLALIDEMLVLSQVDAGNLGLDQAPVDLAEVVQAQAEAWQARMEEKELAFSFSVPDSPVWVLGDRARLSSVLDKLLSNAHAYTLPGGQVSVSLRQEDGFAQVDVADTGVGIAEEDLRFIFKRFYRAIHNKDTYDISGAGLGLYLSKAIIEAHQGGQIWVESELNRGSTFSFKLPLIELSELDDGEEPAEYVHSI